ncbi:MAG: threonine--tRNA ligase [bacterium]
MRQGEIVPRRTCPKGSHLLEVAKEVSLQIGKLIVAARIDGEIIELTHRLEEETEVEFLTLDLPDAREIYRHTASHIMAHAVKRLFPDAKLGIGPPIEDGFYYDFDLKDRITDDDLCAIEAKMGEIVAENLALERVILTKQEALKLFSNLGESYKVELIGEIPDNDVAIYKQGEFVDLCRGPHLPSTGLLRSFKLTSVAGAYWRGDEKNPMLQRIYGTAFENDEQLHHYLSRMEEAKRRDHRRLGVELDLFSISEEAGAGLAYWHPKGAVVRRIIEDFWKSEHDKRGYQLVYTPHIARAGLWRASGHFDYYSENMYIFEVEREQYVLKPMNCVGHILIYKSRKRSYRELPIRLAELGTVYRRERSGTLHGLMRVRGFTQDDAHIFCSREQIEEEVKGVLDLAMYMLSSFGFEKYEMSLSVRDPSTPWLYAGNKEDWDAAEKTLASVLEGLGIEYERCEGEAVFYGPKIDVKLLDALGRGWQGPTIQFDFNLPQRLGVEYTGKDGKDHNVVMIHRTVLGAMERFMGVLVEHYGGAFPCWLAPIQVTVLPVLETNEGYARKIAELLRENEIRVEATDSSEKLGYRIRQKTMEKIPYLLIVGHKEQEKGTVSVRKRKVGDMGSMTLDRVVAMVREDILRKSQ